MMSIPSACALQTVAGRCAVAVAFGLAAPALAHGAGHPAPGRAAHPLPAYPAPAPDGPSTPPTAVPSAAWETSAAAERRTAALLAQMTQEEKLDLVTGDLNNNYGFYNAPIPRLGIPAQTMADGPVGVRVANPGTNDRRSTEMPSGSSLAATWNRARAADYADVLGREAFATGHNVLLAPTVDVVRDPRWGRAFEGFGEDPTLTSALAVPYVRAVQRHGVMATVKHFAVYTQETDRFDVSSEIDERTLQELYLPAFRAAVQEGHVAAAMCAFNRINGVSACENPLMNDVLKQQFGFAGFVMSDYNATPSTVGAALAGLDQEQPGNQGPGSANFGDRLGAAIAAGQVPQSRLDDMVRRILRPMFGLGLFDRTPVVAPLPVAEHGRRSRAAGAEGMVLLKNDRELLPLGGRRTRSIAVIGPDADNASAKGGGSSTISRPTYEVSPLEGLRDRARRLGATVTYAPGTDGINEGDDLPGPPPVPSSVLSTGGADPQPGLRAQYWSNTAFAGDPLVTETDPTVNVNYGFQNFPGFSAASPKATNSQAATNRAAAGDFGFLGDLSARWTGQMTAPATGDYALSLTARGSARLYLDDELVLEHEAEELSTVSRTVPLVGGEAHDVRIEYAAPAANSYQGGQVRFGWQHDDTAVTPAMAEAVDLARRSDTAVVVVRDYETEGLDRASLDLPREQDELIRRVAAVNPRTVVVVETGAPVVTSTWEDGVRAIVQAWYPGQEQGNAIADVLFGDVNPSGRLPVTIPVSTAQSPTAAPEQFPGVGGVARFGEGVFVGYRGYDALGLRPQYPFGHGLSYTRFGFRDLRIDDGRPRPRTTRRYPQGDVRARFTVANTGDRAGSAVAQVYVGRLPSATPTPPRQLAGFAKVALRPGERRRVSVTIPRRALSYWDATQHAWVTPRGRVAVSVGASSRDLALRDTIRVR
jgi:beta-glucosidase